MYISIYFKKNLITAKFFEKEPYIRSGHKVQK